MFRNLISFLRCPEEGRPFDFKPKSILSSFWLYLVAVMGLMILAAVVVYILGEAFPTLMQKKIVDHGDTPKWIVALLAPLLEEGAFRLTLYRKKVNIAISLTLISFLLVSSFCFSQKIYCEDHLLIRIGIALVAGVCLFLLLGKFMMNCRFKPYFWFWGVFFGCIHLMNANYAGMLPLDYISLALYTVTHVIMGLVLGYVRLKNSFATSTLFHVLTNLI